MAHCFPQEIIVEVLCRLPAKSLIKCTLVCKSWRSMIKNPRFICTHLNRKVHSLLLLHSVSCTHYSPFRHIVFLKKVTQELYSLHHDNHAFDEYCKIDLPPAHKEVMGNPFFRVAGICNGLVCLADDWSYYCYTLIIWNPCIRKSVILPRPGVTFDTSGGYDASTGFGYDATTNDYKVVRLVTLLDQPGSPTLAEVYSLATGSWRSLGIAPPCHVDGREPQAFVNGALHCAVLRRENGAFYYFILAFDVGSELFREVKMPKSLKWDELSRLSVSGDRKSIALFTSTDSFMEIWVMKEYCVEESWTKLITLNTQGPERSLTPKCFRKSDEVVLLDEAGNELVSLDFVSEQSKSLGIRGCEHYYVDSYEESLVLLDKKDAVSH